MTRLPSKTPAARHAQMRRDNEIEVREAVRVLIPQEYFTEEAQDMNQLNPSSRVFVAMKKYLEKRELEDHGEDGVAEDEGVKNEQLSVPRTKLINEPSDETLQQLRQVANRLVQKAEEKMQVGASLSDLKHIFELISDSMIDNIKTIEDA